MLLKVEELPKQYADQDSRLGKRATGNMLMGGVLVSWNARIPGVLIPGTRGFREDH